MISLDKLSTETENRIKEDREKGLLSPYAFRDENVIRRNPEKDKADIIRTAYIRDCDKIIHCPFYNRYADKTQVFSLWKNDDLSRRSLHVQLVSRIGRTIGKALGLNLDLIEAISLGHDIGHTPFGHAGEAALSKISYGHCGRYFNHNIQSVRVLDGVYPYNISLETLSGIASHNGEIELNIYRPQSLTDFTEFDRQIDLCYTVRDYSTKLVPSTLEGCVMRISDIIAYLGKDRQDAARAKIISEDAFSNTAIGKVNAEIINRLIVNIVENSYGKPYIMLDDEHFRALKDAKRENYEKIYKSKAVTDSVETVKSMMERMYDRFLEDLEKENLSSPIYTHHINYVNRAHYTRTVPYEAGDKNQIVTDYIAGMTDDYFADLYAYLFPEEEPKLIYRGYFE